MTQVTIVVDNSQAEVEKQINRFFKDYKKIIEYVDIKYVVSPGGFTYAMIIYDLIEKDENPTNITL